ncbi:uncharacterized protein LOC141982175 [Natator depressus]|uniref:uncharacterized protein LOC141982175 n=1 Tax=Natator depressus TaxID=27790 RepID=UPI003EB6D44A
MAVRGGRLGRVPGGMPPSPGFAVERPARRGKRREQPPAWAPVSLPVVEPSGVLGAGSKRPGLACQPAGSHDTRTGHSISAAVAPVPNTELRNAYRKAHEANSHSGAAPVTCRFYKELDAILGGNPTSAQSTTIGTSEPSATRQDKEEQSGSEGGKAQEDAPESLDACSQELFSSQEEGSQLRRPVLGEGQTPEEVPDATLRSQLSMLSPAERLQRIRKRPRRSKEDMLHEVMQHSSNENQKVQEWRDSERKICQQNEERRRKSTVLRKQSTDRLISVMERQVDSIQALVAMQVELYRA